MNGPVIVAQVAWRLWAYAPLLLIISIAIIMGPQVEWFADGWDAYTLLTEGEHRYTTVQLFYYMMPIAQIVALATIMGILGPKAHTVRPEQWILLAASQVYMTCPYMWMNPEGELTQYIVPIMGSTTLVQIVILLATDVLGRDQNGKAVMAAALVCITAFHLTIFFDNTPGKFTASLVSLVLGLALGELGYFLTSRSEDRMYKKELPL